MNKAKSLSVFLRKGAAGNRSSIHSFMPNVLLALTYILSILALELLIVITIFGVEQQYTNSII